MTDWPFDWRDAQKKQKYLNRWRRVKLTGSRKIPPLQKNPDSTDYGEDLGGARDVIVIVVGNEHGDTSSNPGRNSLHFT